MEISGNAIIVTGRIAGNNINGSGLGLGSTSIAGGTHPYVFDDAQVLNSNAEHPYETFIASYTDNGTTVSNNWVDFISAPLYANCLTVDGSGNIYIGGHAYESFNFPSTSSIDITDAGGAPDHYMNGSYVGGNDIDAYILCYTNNGTRSWGKLYGGTGSDNHIVFPGSTIEGSLDLAATASALYLSILSSGELQGASAGASFQNEFGMHLLNLNPSNGAVNWSKGLAEPLVKTSAPTVMGNVVQATYIEANSANEIYYTGSYLLQQSDFPSIDFYSTVGGPTVLTLSGGTPTEVGLVTGKFSSTGTFEWAQPNRTLVPGSSKHIFELAGKFMPTDIDVNDCGVYQSINLDGTADFHGANYAGSPRDAFVIRTLETTSGPIYGKTASNNNSNMTSLQNQELLESKVVLGDDVLLKKGLGIKVYPNPTMGKFTLELEGTEEFAIEVIRILDVTGKSIGKELGRQKFENEYDLDLSKSPEGIYFIQIITEQTIMTKRILLIK